MRGRLKLGAELLRLNQDNLAGGCLEQLGHVGAEGVEELVVFPQGVTWEDKDQ